MKKCSKCKIEYDGPPEDNFYRNRTRKLGWAVQCKKCSNQGQNKRQRRARENYYYERNLNNRKLKLLARLAARKFYKEGRYFCSVLGCPSLADELHHVNYNDPLAVVPFCKKHHDQNHDVC